MFLSAALGLALPSCTVSEQNYTRRFDAVGVVTLASDVEQGRVEYQGGTRPEKFEFNLRSWGSGTTAEKAATRREGNTWDVSLEQSALWLNASSEATLAGVDTVIRGPESVSMDIVVQSGEAVLSGAWGWHVVTAEAIEAFDLYGSSDLYAEDSIEARLFPESGDPLRLEVENGPCELELGYGPEYSLQIWGSPDHELYVEDFGFHSVSTSPGYFAGVAGSGDTVVQIFVSAGSVRVLQAD